MALLRNREVTIVGKADAADHSPVVTVSYANGTKENAKLVELQLTNEEYKDMLRLNGEVYMHNVQKVDDATLQDIRDSQDRAKIEARQNEKPAEPTPSVVSPVAIKPTKK